MDESGSHVAMSRTHARAPRGERASDKVPRNRGTIITMIGALSLAGLGPLMTVEGGTSGEVFLAYMEQVLLPVVSRGDIIVLDNLGAHKDARVRAAAQHAGVRLVYQPAYSPELNPIELAWAKLKWFLKVAKARTKESLDTAIAFAADIIGLDGDAPGWFRHCGWQWEPLP